MWLGLFFLGGGGGGSWQCWRVNKRPSKEEKSGVGRTLKYRLRWDRPFLMFRFEAEVARSSFSAWIPRVACFRRVTTKIRTSCRAPQTPYTERCSIILCLRRRAAQKQPTLRRTVCDGPDNNKSHLSHLLYHPVFCFWLTSSPLPPSPPPTQQEKKLCSGTCTNFGTSGALHQRW